MTPICNGNRKLQLIRSTIIALAVISFVYFEIHSCSKDEVAAPTPPDLVVDNLVLAATDVYFRDADFGCVSGAAGTLMITADGGRTWSGEAIDGGNLNDVQFLDRERGWVAGKDGSLYSTVDGGRLWIRAESAGLPPSEDYYKITFANVDLGYALGYGGVYHTSDGGASWRNDWLPSVADRGALDMSFVSDRAGFLLGSRYLEADPVVLYRTTDGAVTWIPVEGSRSSTLRTVLTITFLDDLTGWAGGGVIMKTVDGGATWETQRAPATVRELFFLDPDDGFAVGGKTILRTNDGGAAWADITPADDRILDLRGVHFLDTERGWVVGRGPDVVAGGKTYKRSILLATGNGGESWTIREFLFDAATVAGAEEIVIDG